MFRQEKAEVALQHYLQLLSKYLSTTTQTIDDQTRVILREYRQQHSITGVLHVEALKQVGWTLDDYEVGQRDDALVRQQSSRNSSSSSSSQEQQRGRGSVFSSISSWIFGSPSISSSSSSAVTNSPKQQPPPATSPTSSSQNNAASG